MNQRQLFLQHVAQTSDAPLAIEISRAENCILEDVNGKQYIDLIAGIGVCNVGHCHPAVVKAIQQQAKQYLHVMVYGELVESPQVQYATLLSQLLPSTLNSVYFTNSGAEATEGAMKLAKRYTGRTEIIAFKHSYHGSTQGALSLIGDEYWRNAYRPLLPDVRHLEYNSIESLETISTRTACVVAETIQAESGVTKPDAAWLLALKQKCSEAGALLILDEIQCGFGRTGTLFAFEQFGVVPDILLLGKALGGGMPLGAFIAPQSIMQVLTHQPVLGHITTFGGHPVSCAAGLAALQAMMNEKLLDSLPQKQELFAHLLKPLSVKQAGLWLAVAFDSFETNKKIIDYCIAHGVFTDWFLFAPHCLRIGPPLTISEEQIRQSCAVILEAVASLHQ